MFHYEDLNKFENLEGIKFKNVNFNLLEYDMSTLTKLIKFEYEGFIDLEDYNGKNFNLPN